jgi:hypothetical protein
MYTKAIANVAQKIFYFFINENLRYINIDSIDVYVCRGGNEIRDIKKGKNKI